MGVDLLQHDPSINTESSDGDLECGRTKAIVLLLYSSYSVDSPTCNEVVNHYVKTLLLRVLRSHLVVVKLDAKIDHELRLRKKY